MEKQALLRQGWMVFIALVMLTVLEFLVAIANLGSATMPLLVILMVPEVALIMEYYMHLSRVFQPEKGDH